MKKYLVLSLALLSLFALFLTFREGSPLYIPPNAPQQTQDVQSVTTETTETQEQEVTLMIDAGEESPLVFTEDFEEGETAYSLLQKVSERDNITVETEQYDFGIFVKSINGFESTADMSWIYFVNGESGQVAADQHELEPEDVVEWKYVEPSDSE